MQKPTCANPLKKHNLIMRLNLLTPIFHPRYPPWPEGLSECWEENADTEGCCCSSLLLYTSQSCQELPGGDMRKLDLLLCPVREI